MVEIRHAEQHLSQELADTRAHLRDHLLLLRRDLDFGRRIIRSTHDRPFERIIVAFMAGWLLSRLPARKNEIYYSPDQERAKGHRQKTRSTLRKVVWSASKPVLAAYLAKSLQRNLRRRAAEPRKRTEKGERSTSFKWLTQHR
jgi:hypothetical protein